jgi:hypothetical protein
MISVFRSGNRTAVPSRLPGIVLIAPRQDPVVVDRYQYEVRLGRRGDEERAVDKEAVGWRRFNWR